MKQLIGHRNALLAFSDSAGAKAVLALADAHRSNFNRVTAVSNRIYSFYVDFGFEVLPYGTRNPQEWMEVSQAQLLITGTSLPRGLELELIHAARRSGVTSISLIDHWTNLAERFRTEDSHVLPDWIFVVDERARLLATNEGLPSASIVVTGNPYHDYLRRWQPSKSRNAFLREIGLPADARYMLYAPEPLSRFGLAAKCGFDELDGLKMILQALRSDLDANKYLVVKAHPNQRHEVFEEFFGNSSGFAVAYPRGLSHVSYLKEGDLTALIDSAECVLGFFSNSLVEASVLGKTVIRPLMRLRDTYADSLTEFEGPHFISVRDTSLFEQMVLAI